MVFRMMSTTCETNFAAGSLNFSFMKDNPKPISAAPLMRRLKARGAKAKFAHSLNVPQARVTNWLKRGIPAGMVGKVAVNLDLSHEEYIREATGADPAPAHDELYVELAEYWPHIPIEEKNELMKKARAEAFETLKKQTATLKDVRGVADTARVKDAYYGAKAKKN